MAKWDESFYTGSLGGQDLLRTVQTPLPLKSGVAQTYAFGLTVTTWRGLRRVSHSGALAGFRTAILRFPEQHFSAIVLCNFAQANPTGVTISTPLGAVGAGLSNLRALGRGEITPTQYLEQIGWGMLQSATFGAAFGFLGAALSRGPTTALSRPSPAGGGGAVEPDFVFSPVRVNPQTGAVSQMAFHRPTGQYYVAEYNPITGTGQVINQSSGLQVATFFNGRFYPPMASLQAPGQPGAGPTAAPPPAGVPMGPPGLIPGGMAAS